MRGIQGTFKVRSLQENRLRFPHKLEALGVFRFEHAPGAWQRLCHDDGAAAKNLQPFRKMRESGKLGIWF